MFSTVYVVFIIFNFSFLVLASDLYGPHPRIVSNNGNLVIYAANHKNVSIKTTGRGYINLNDENLIPLLKNARNASITMDRFTTNVIGPLSSTVKSMTDLIYGSDGLLRRVSNLENNTTGAGPIRPLLPRNRNWLQLTRRVRMLETSMMRILNLLTTNECESNPCKNGGECIDMYNGYMCHCPESWTGASCESDVNECTRFHGTDLGCQNGATCINKQGAYECICATGWFGLHCNRRTHDCNSGTPQDLCGHGTCIPQNTPVGYKCICDQGWTTNSISPACTIDVNECDSTKSPVCSVNPLVQCINVPGTFYCGSCPAGYTGNGFYCNDIDECLNYNGGCSINPKVQCINTLGSRMCGSCPPGYVGDGITCSFQGVCRINNGGCHSLAQCLDNPNIGDNFVQCICPNGYAGNGMGPNGCISAAVSPIITACNSNPCVHGTCISYSNSSFSCSCQSGYTGKTCNVPINPCDSNPCKNGASCKNIENTYSCECTTDYTGQNCDKERQACGGKLIGNTGFLQYPPSNNTNYDHSISCSWVIQTEPEKVLNISFIKFHLEPSNNNNNCLYDWVQVHDGPNSASHMIGRFCGRELPKGGQITTTHNSIYVWFRSDHTVSNPGFALKWNTIIPICSEILMVESHGTLKSPGSPGNYPPNRDCEWILFAPYGKRLQFHFFTLNIGNNPNCSYDSLTIYSGITPLEPIIAQFCNSSHPEPLTTAGSVALVLFHSDASGGYPGFQISYSVIEGIPGCGGIFTAERGEISSPIVDEQYHANSDCEYKIKLHGNARIKITFLSFSVEDSLGCRFDYVSVHEGGRPDSPLVGRYCGANIPPPYTSLGNELFIRFKTDMYINDDGFRIKYETVCGSIYDAPSGIILSFGYPMGTSGVKNCLYEIKQKPGTAIKLTILDMSVGRDSCLLDYLEIRDGDTDNSTLIGKYCGWDPPGEIISTHNYLRIRMVSLSGRTYLGFKANYTTIDLKCGGILKDNLGIIKSPENPDVYPPDTKCVWVISAPPGFVIQLTWVLFNMEWSSTCNADYVAVYENNTDTGNSGLIGKYCSKKLPPTSITTTNLLTLYFVSDSSQAYDGFIVNYNLLDESKTCGGNYFVATGVIRSPNYPSLYPPNKECVWVITVPHGQQIMLNVEHFDLEMYINCGSDYLEIRNGAYANSPLLGIFCGTDIPSTIPSHTNNLYIKFRSDSSHSKKGFQITWDGTTTGCGGTLTSPTGQIISPNYPQPYGVNAMCLWKISTSAGSVLQLLFLDLNLEGQFMCRLDYVEVYDGIDFSSKSFGRYCTETHPISVITSKNLAMVKFRSDVSHQERGFLIKYLTLCNNTLKGYRGVIESLNFPNPYPKNQNCTWTIEVPLGNKINISFSHFELEDTLNLQNIKTCKFDYVEIVEKFDYSPDQILLNKSCGLQLPPYIHSTTNTVMINFVTDSVVNGAGFRLEWVVDGCSGLLTRPEGRIATPGYPYGYPTETVCEWIIQVDFDSAIELTIGKFDFETSNDCSYDSLQIFNGPDENAPLISKVCHADEKGFIATSTSNSMLVKFTSDSSYAGRGFEANYKTVTSQCGGKYTAPMGSIHSRNYPKNYKMRDDCEWLIEIAKNHIVELEFHEFDFVSTTNCTSDYLKIYDGNSINAHLLKTLCGGQALNETIKSSTNALLIRMTTGTRGTAKGFLANYTTGCGSRLVTSTNGMIEIADWGSWECAWTIIADEPDKHVSLSITHLDVSSNCESPALHIYDGDSTEAPLIGNYCGTKAPSMIVSKGSSLHINLSYAYGAYIRATYTVISTECGATMTSLSGYFGSLGYPNNYPMNTECQWTINLAPGNKVLLTFLEFDLIYTENCNADYVEVREKDAAGKLLGIFCGNTVPTNISQTNSLWVQFKSSNVGTAKGFLAEYVLSHGNELFGNKGQIASPLYPLSFGQSDQVTWRITVEFHSVILITFKDFYVDWSAGGDCYFLGLEIYDGYDDTSPSLASLCTLHMPEPIRSSSNVVFIKYFTGSYRYTLKFLLEWVQVQQPINIKDISNNLSVEGCGSDTVIDLTLLNHTYPLNSPGFPNGYAGNLKCEWIFSTVPEKHLSISFITMDLEANNPKCMLDNVKIYTGDEGQPNWRILNTVCLSNSTLMNDIHTSNFMKVVFKSDAYINKTGFAAHINSECGGSLTGSNGIIEINNSTTRRRYSSKLQCEWNITVKAGRTIKINFLEFNIPNSKENVCSINYILLKNGRYPDSPLLGKGKYCGTTIPEINATIGNSLYIKYFSAGTSQGFKLSYTDVSLACGKHIKLTNSYNTTNISSPNYPDIPPAHTECIWIISAPVGETIQINFVDRFDITYSTNCVKAGVELRDGGTLMSNIIDTYCTDIPSTQKTTDNLLYVRFFTDVSDPKNGFKATVSIATCGGVIRGKSGKLTSPYFPAIHSFPVNTICTWQIIGPIDHYLNITFNEFKLIYRSNCSNSNHLLVTEKLPWGNETTLATLCGARKPADIRTSSNAVTIQMKILLPSRVMRGFSLNFNSSQETCGGTIEADSGFITSPGYPVSNHYNRNCDWFIIVPEGRRVTVNIIDFDLDYSGYYYSQGLAFYSSKNYKSNIAYLHRSDPRKEFKSSTNFMLVYFWSASTSNHRGFKLSFNSDEATICAGDLNNNSGVIETPKINLTSYFCEWNRKPKENDNVFANQTIALIVDAPVIGKPDRHNCKYSMTTITVTSETDSELVRQLCGSYSEPQIIRNPYPTTKLTVLQDKYSSRMNFTITYKIHPCGGILTSTFGSISSPNYPNRYTNTVDCAWLIKIEEGQALKLNFTSMELDTSCTKDYIDIHNGPSATSPKIGRYCGTNHPSLIQSQGNALWIEYHTSVGGRGKGFALNYAPLTAGCGGIFHDKGRVVQTPNYPSSYPNDIECVWEIRSEDGYHVGLQFIDRFHIEDSKNCTNDYMEVLDYEDDNWTSLGRYCGRVQPQTFNSSTNRLRVLFRSNSQLQASGFKATWNFNCGGTFVATETPKYLISPGYPIGYTRDLDCKYNIIAPKKYVNIIFEDLVLEEGRGSAECAFDNVTIGRQRFMGSPWLPYRLNNRTDLMYINIGVFCGTKVPPPFRRQDGLRIWFRSDKWVHRKGFKLKYFIDTCGGSITEDKEISSPLDSTGRSTYYSSLNCLWNITAPKNKVVVVKFTFFELEHHRNCQYDNVALYDGSSSVNITDRLALLCGNITSNLPVIRSNGNNMLIVMKTDASNHFKGFKAIVLFMHNEKVGCGGTVNLTQDQPLQTLRSPDIDGSGQYLSNLDCHWLILAPVEETIELNFNSFHLSPCNTSFENQKCTCDFLQIRDGGGPLSELMAQTCGHDNPIKITSSGTQLWIRMVTDGVQSSTGFRATVKKVASICGKSVLHVTDSKQILSSPGFPENYPNNIRCVWILRSNSTLARFEIHFDHMELQKPDVEDKCSTDKLEISDKLSMHSVSEGLGEKLIFSGPKSMTNILGVRLPTTSFTYCGVGQPPDFHSMRNEIVISFVTDSSITKKGFQLDYRLAGCNRNYTAVQGRLLNEGISKECIIKILAPMNYTISLYFQGFFINDYQNCKLSGMEIHDGNSSESPQLAKLCGYQIPNPVFSSNNEIWMKVKTHRKGLGIYDIIYTTTNQGRGCGGEIYNYMGRFTSPMYPNNYRNNSVCRWNLSVPRGLRVALKFTIFDLGPIDTCSTDYVELIDINAISKQETLRSRYCSADNPAIFFAASNYMAVRYVTSTNNAGSGWIAVFSGKEQIFGSNSTF